MASRSSTACHLASSLQTFGLVRLLPPPDSHILLAQAGAFHQVAKQARLQRAVAMDGHAQDDLLTGLGKDVVASIDAVQRPTGNA